MKLQPDKADVQTVTALGPGWVAINGQTTRSSVVVGARGENFAWSCNQFESLGPEHFAQLVPLNAEVVIFGSGSQLRFPRPQWIAPLIAQGIGVEAMDTAAACRTYNILAAEGRHVVAALLIDQILGST